MKRYLLKRFLWMLPTLAGITIITFVIIHLAPGDPADALYAPGEEANPAAIAEFRKTHRLDEPVPAQYWHWLKRVVTLDFGNEYSGSRQSVMGEIWKRLKVTVPLGVVSLFLAYLLSVPLGIFCAMKKGTVLERLITFAVFFLYSLPAFWVASLLVVFLCSGAFLKVFPVLGLHSADLHFSFGDYFTSFFHLGEPSSPLPPFSEFFLDLLHHAFLPILCLTYGQLAFLSRQMKSEMTAIRGQDYIRTAKAKGLRERTIIGKHMLRNSLIPMVTHLGALIPALIGGSIVVEKIFNIPGMGFYIFDAVDKRDYNVIMAVSFLSALLTMAAMLLSDILYVFINPKISLEN